MRLSLLARQLIYSLKTVFVELGIVANNQSLDAKILQTSHRLEKGLTISNPRDMWGWDKAYSLLSLIERTSNEFSKETGYYVLEAYVQHKMKANSDEDKKRAHDLHDRLENIKIEGSVRGGSIDISKAEVLNINFEAAKKLFYSRHSVRDFDGTSVSVEKILDAIELANRCPSACNRQPYKVYVVDDNKWQAIRNDGNQVYGADKHLLITADIYSFNLDEFNDWFVSASIFAGYLSLALTVVGLGSCVIRKPCIYNPSIERLKRELGIPNSEKVIIEIAVGNYKDNFKVAYSNRKHTDDLVTIIK